MMAGYGGFAGGLAAGLESNRQHALRERQVGLQEEDFGLRKREADRLSEQRDRESQVYVDLHSAIARRLQQRAAAQTQAPGIQTSGEQATPAEGGGDAQVATMALEPRPAIEGRSLGANEAPAATGHGLGTSDAGLGARGPAAGDDALATPGLERRGPVTASASQGTPSQQVGFNLYQNTNLLRDPDFLNEAAQIFLKAKMPQGVKWLEMAFAAQERNGFDALKALAVGDTRRAVQLFNSSGQVKVEGATQITDGPDKGKWQVQFAGGQSRVVDPAQELKSYLDPKEFFALMDKERDDARASERDKATATYQGRMAGVAERNAATNEQFRADQAESMRRRDEAYARGVDNRGRGGGDKPLTEKDYNNLSAKVESHLRRQMRDTAPTDPTGKKMNNPLSEFVSDIRQDIMTDVRGGVEPEVAMNNRYVEWAEKFDKADRVLGQAFDKAREAGSGIFKGRADTVLSLRNSLRELERQGVSVDEARRFAQAAGRDMKLFREAAAGLAGGQVARGAPGLDRRGAPAAGPKEGDRRTVNGVEYVWRGGRPVPVQ